MDKINLTEKEKVLLQYFIDETDGSNSVVFQAEYMPKLFVEQKLDISVYKGVFSSLVKKGFLEFWDTLDNGGGDKYDVYHWKVIVESDDHGRKVNNVEELLTAMQENRDWTYWNKKEILRR